MVFLFPGSTFYLARDVLVQAFYALGDGRTPLYVTIGGIMANAVLDWTFVSCSRLGAAGLVTATMTVNFASAGVLLFILTRKLGEFRVGWHRPCFTLVCCSLYTSVATSAAYGQAFLLVSSWTSSSGISNFLALGVATALGFASFFAPLVLLRSPEISWVVQLLQTKSRT